MTYLVDANNLLHIVWFATKTKSFQNMLKSFMMLMYGSCKYSNDGQFITPNQIRVVWDSFNGYWRNNVFVEYKGTRKEAKDNDDTELFNEVRDGIVKHIRRNTPLKQISIENLEADDVIAEIIRKALKRKKGEFVILSNDKDYAQLIRKENPFVAIQKLGKAKEKYDGLLTYEKFVEEYDIEPKLWACARSLMGDSSDNIPGINGIGEKTALKIIQRYGHLKNWINGVKVKEGDRIDHFVLLSIDERKKVKQYYKLICLLRNYSDVSANIKEGNTL